MDIGTKTRCFRQSKRHDLLTGQWEQKRYQQHRDRITNAEPRIDVKTPVSDSFQHVKIKPKKIQHELERGTEVMMQNLILLRHLTEISNSKRVNDGIPIKNKHRMSWNGYYDTILNMRRLQLEDMRQMLLDGGNIENFLETNENGNQPETKNVEKQIHGMMSSSSVSNIPKEENTPSTSPTSGIPKPRNAASKRVRPKTAGPAYSSTRYNTKDDFENKRVHADHLSGKNSGGNTNYEKKTKNANKRIRSTSAHKR